MSLETGCMYWGTHIFQKWYLGLSLAAEWTFKRHTLFRCVRCDDAGPLEEVGVAIIHDHASIILFSQVGPTVCQQFYNFLTRLRELSHESQWTSCLKEILLQVLCAFLSGPFLNADFPLDAFNKFLDRVTCPDLSYENPATVVKIIEQCGKLKSFSS